MLIVNLAGRFLLELAAIGSVGYWGFQVGGASPVRILFAAGAIALLVLVWAFVIAPNADNHRQHGPALRARARYARNPPAERLTCNSHRPSTGSATAW